MKRFAFVLLCAFMAVALPSGIYAQETEDDAEAADATEAAATVEITEWPVPWEDTRPRDPYVAPDGTVWFVGQRGDYVASLDPASGEFDRIDLPEGAGPHNLIVDDEGTIWYAGNRNSTIGVIDPASGEIEEIPTPEDGVRDPHTLVFDHDGDIWFTAQGANSVSFLDTQTRELQTVPLEVDGARPYGIIVDGNDRPWFTQFGTNRLGTIDPETMELEEVVLPRDDARPRRLQATSDGRVWYVDYSGGYLGVHDPSTGEIEEWPMPGGEDARPYGMAVDDRDRLWFVESGLDPNRFVGFDPATEEYFSVTEIESGGGTVRHMYYHEPTGSIWFGTDTNNIGRALIESLQPVSIGETDPSGRSDR